MRRARAGAQCAAHYSGTGATFRGRDSSRFVERVNLKCTRCAHGYFKEATGRCALCGSSARQTVGTVLLALAVVAALGMVLFGPGTVIAALCVSPALAVLAVPLLLLGAPRVLCQMLEGCLPRCLPRGHTMQDGLRSCIATLGKPLSPVSKAWYAAVPWAQRKLERACRCRCC